MKRDNVILAVIMVLAITGIVLNAIEGILVLKGWRLALRVTAMTLLLISLIATWIRSKRPN